MVIFKYSFNLIILKSCKNLNERNSIKKKNINFKDLLLYSLNLLLIHVLDENMIKNNKF